MAFIWQLWSVSVVGVTHTESGHDFVMFNDAKPQLVKTQWRVNQAQYHQIIHANVHN